MKGQIIENIRGDSYQFDSPEELWFAWWLEEMLAEGVIKWWKCRSTTWELAVGCVMRWQEMGARKALDKSKCLMRPHTYTGDFSFQWSDHKFVHLAMPMNTLTNSPKFFDPAMRLQPDGLYMVKPPFDSEDRIFGPYNEKALMTTTNEDLVTHVDTKGVHTRMHSQDAKFAMIRGIVWDKHGQYVNKVIPHSGDKKKPDCLFRDTFVPKRFLFTDKTAKMRSIPYRARNIGEWLVAMRYAGNTLNVMRRGVEG